MSKRHRLGLGSICSIVATAHAVQLKFWCLPSPASLHSSSKLKFAPPSSHNTASLLASSTASMSVDGSVEEWPLRPDISSTTRPISNKLGEVERARPRLPKLPPADNWNYATATTSNARGAVASSSDEPSEAARRRREVQMLAKEAGFAVDQDVTQRSVRFDPVTAASTTASEAQRIDQLYDDTDEGVEKKSVDEATDAVSEATGDDAMRDDEAIVNEIDPAAAAAAASSSTAVSSTSKRTPREPLADHYDPQLDASDEAWVRSRGNPSSSKTSVTRSRGGHRTDAFLACPACFSPLCVDCQRHATRRTHFRAMFVLDAVLVDRGRFVRPIQGTVDPEEKDGKFRVVLCKTCKSHVGVQDDDEIYHFFNVIESQG